MGVFRRVQRVTAGFLKKLQEPTSHHQRSSKLLNACILVKVLTLLTVLIFNGLSPYKTPYNFWKVLTSLMANDLSPYTIVNGKISPH